jgi:hypothetical protein
MANVKQRKEAEIFISEGIEESRRYEIQNVGNGHVLVCERQEFSKEPKTIDIVLANCVGKVANFVDLHRENARNRVYTAPVLYKDKKSAFVRLLDSDEQYMHHQTLKRYENEQKHEMLKLRKIEKSILQYFGRVVQYYQPETERLPECLRKFRMDVVMLDYNHVDPETDAGRHVHNRASVDFKLPNELENERIYSEAEIGFQASPDHYWRGKLNRLHTLPPEDFKKRRQFMLNI